MSKFTKMAITNCFIELSEEMPIEKITVTEITRRCGINRNTFYYHYQDVYSLLEEIIYTKCEKLFVSDRKEGDDSWPSTLRFIGQYAKKNEEFIKSIYQSMDRDSFEDYMADVSYKSIHNTIEATLRKACEDGTLLKLSEEHKKSVSDVDSNLLRRNATSMKLDISIYEPEIKEASQLFSRFFAQISVDWIRGKSGNDPVQIMENVITTYQGVPEVIIKNILLKHLQNNS